MIAARERMCDTASDSQNSSLSRMEVRNLQPQREVEIYRRCTTIPVESRMLF